MTERTVQVMRKSEVTMRAKVVFSRDQDNKLKTWEYFTDSKVPFGTHGEFLGIKASGAGSGYYGTRIPFKLDLNNDVVTNAAISQWLHPEGHQGEGLAFTYYENGNQKTAFFNDRNNKKPQPGSKTGFTVGLDTSKKDDAGQTKTVQVHCLFDLNPRIRKFLKEDMWVEVKGNWEWSMYQNQDNEWRESRSLGVTSIRAVDEPKSGIGACIFVQELIMTKDSWQWNEAAAKNGVQYVNAKTIYKSQAGQNGVKGPHAFDFKFELRNNRNVPLDVWKKSLEDFFNIKEDETKAVRWQFKLEGGSSTSAGKVNPDDPFAGDYGDDEDDEDGLGDIEVTNFTQAKFVFFKPSQNPMTKTWPAEDYGLSLYTVGEQGDEVSLDDLDVSSDPFGGASDPFGGTFEAPAATTTSEPASASMTASEIVNAPEPTSAPEIPSVNNADDDLDDLFD